MMGFLGGRSQAQTSPSASELAKAVPGGGEALRDEAEIVAAASDPVLRRRFATVWAKDFAIPVDLEKRVEAVQTAIITQEREDLAELSGRADRIGRLSDEERTRIFGAGPLPSDQLARTQATVDLALLEAEGFESPRVAAERALQKARAVRDALSLDRGGADRFEDVSPLARLTWKHVPEMAARLGVQIGPQEGYSKTDPEYSDAGLAIHNSGSDARAASRFRPGFSRTVNHDLDMLIGPQGAGGIVERMVENAAGRERRRAVENAPPRALVRDMSAAAFLSGIISR
ncbi:hypothetical protein [Sphingomonas sp. 3-13AW]|uniref:hypothetical protein n=1 Tax=Sphingomonas sp. 3-13AW TaxID=3050450 RepID=UPI003BB53F36